MPTLIDSPSFTTNEVYEIQATDPVEGAATGASYGGIGLSNQPHQQLANRTSLLYGRQQTNMANIAALQAFTGQFKGMMAASGYVEVPFVDAIRGQIVAVVQWGSYFPPGGDGQDATYSISWPTSFPNACVWAMAALSNSSANKSCGKLVMETVSFTTTTGTFMSDFIGGSTSTQAPNDGFYWIAIGF